MMHLLNLVTPLLLLRLNAIVVVAASNVDNITSKPENLDIILHEATTCDAWYTFLNETGIGHRMTILNDTKNDTKDKLNSVVNNYGHHFSRCQNHVDSTPTYSCPETTSALTTLLEKIERDLCVLEDKVTEVPKTKDKLEDRVLQLTELENLTNRLDNVVAELLTEILGTCTNQIRSKFQIVMEKLSEVKSQINKNYHQRIVEIMTKIVIDLKISNNEKKLLKTELRTALRSLPPLERDKTLIELVKNVLYTKNPIGSISSYKNFDGLLIFAKEFDRHSPGFFDSTIEILLDGVRLDPKRFQFLMSLAYESRRHPGTNLRNKFPEAIGLIFWGHDLCIRNHKTNRYLLADLKFHTQKDFEHVPFEISQLNKSIGTNELVEEGFSSKRSCGWTFFPSVKLTPNPRVEFIIRPAGNLVSDSSDTNQRKRWAMMLKSNNIEIGEDQNQNGRNWVLLPDSTSTMFHIQTKVYQVSGMNAARELCSEFSNGTDNNVPVSLNEYSAKDECLWILEPSEMLSTGIDI